MKVEFEEGFFEKLSETFVEEKGLNDYVRNWVPIFVSVVTLIVFLYVSLFVPYRQEADIKARISGQIKIEKMKVGDSTELLTVPIAIHNYGKRVILEKYADIVFIGDNESRVTVQGVFQKNGSFNIDSRDTESLSLNSTNYNLSSITGYNSFSELIGTVSLRVRIKIRDRHILSNKVKFKEEFVKVD